MLWEDGLCGVGWGGVVWCSVVCGVMWGGVGCDVGWGGVGCDVGWCASHLTRSLKQQVQHETRLKSIGSFTAVHSGGNAIEQGLTAYTKMRCCFHFGQLIEQLAGCDCAVLMQIELFGAVFTLLSWCCYHGYSTYTNCHQSVTFCRLLKDESSGYENSPWGFDVKLV